MGSEAIAPLTDAISNLADFGLSLAPESVPTSAGERASLKLLDRIGICALATPMEADSIGWQAALLRHSSSDPDHSSRMLFDGRCVLISGAHARGPELTFCRNEAFKKYVRFAVPELGDTRTRGLWNADLALTEPFDAVARHLHDLV